MTLTQPAPVYVLGHDDAELRRLQLQAEMIAPVTRRLIRECGIQRGMRVLDIGCGAGDVAMLLAEAVGPDGQVIAIDRETRAVETARFRARQLGLDQITFVVGTDQSLPDGALFDVAFGRYVLLHQPDPSAFLERVSTIVRPGGMLAFHEVALHVDGLTSPTIDLYVELNHRIRSAYRSLLPSYDLGGRLLDCFTRAGLSQPRVIWESIVGDHRSSMLRCLAMSYFSILSHIHALGFPPLAETDIEQLTARLEEEAAKRGTQIVSRPQACAWANRR